jgi:hypothetical protein
MDSKKRFTQNLVKLVFLLFILYVSLFYIAPFLSGIVTSIFHTGSQVVVKTTVNKPLVTNFSELTNKDQISIEGVTSGNVSVELFLNDASYGTITSENDGKFKFENVGILKGKNKYYLIAKNNEGVESEKSKEYSFDYDDKAPEIKTINLSNGQEIKNLNKNINILGETNELCDIEINGKKVFKKDGNKFEYLLGVSEGEVKIEIKLLDKAGNESKIYYNVNYRKD